MNFAVKLAHAILDLEAERDMLAQRCMHLEGVEEKYQELLDSGIAHSQHMLGGMLGGILELAMKPGAMDATAKSNQGVTDA